MKLSKTDMQKINKAFDLVTKNARGETRNLVFRVPEELRPYPYWGHLNSVLEQLIVLGTKDIDVLVAGILHDIVEDHNVSFEKIENEFGKNVQTMVELCTKSKEFDSKVKNTVDAYYNRIWDYIEIDKKIALGAMRIKVCDRITNLIGVQFTKDQETKDRYINESIEYFIPMAKKVKLLAPFNNVLYFANGIGGNVLEE